MDRGEVGGDREMKGLRMIWRIRIGGDQKIDPSRFSTH